MEEPDAQVHHLVSGLPLGSAAGCAPLDGNAVKSIRVVARTMAARATKEDVRLITVNKRACPARGA
jgi:hypothetical protein